MGEEKLEGFQKVLCSPRGWQAATEATGHQGTKLRITQDAQKPASTHVAASLKESLTPVHTHSSKQGSRARGKGLFHPAMGVTLTCGSFWDLRVGLSGHLLAGGSLIH